MGFDDYTKRSLKEFIDGNKLTANPTLEPIIVGTSIPPLSQRFKIVKQLIVTVTNHEKWMVQDYAEKYGIELTGWEFHQKDDLTEAVQFLADEYDLQFDDSFYKGVNADETTFLMLGISLTRYIK